MDADTTNVIIPTDINKMNSILQRTINLDSCGRGYNKNNCTSSQGNGVSSYTIPGNTGDGTAGFNYWAAVTPFIVQYKTFGNDQTFDNTFCLNNPRNCFNTCSFNNFGNNAAVRPRCDAAPLNPPNSNFVYNNNNPSIGVANNILRLCPCNNFVLNTCQSSPVFLGTRAIV